MEENKEKLTKEQSFKTDLYFWLQALVVALVSLIVVFAFFGRIIGVDGSSMVPTLHDRDLLLLQSIGYTPERGDVVVLNKPFGEVNGPIVKRVIATEGQTVDIAYDAGGVGTVWVDGQALEEYYINEAMTYPTYTTLDFPVTVPEDCVFVMGDNRNHSADSRYPDIGMFSEDYILGKALIVVWPGQENEWTDREFSRIGAIS